MKKTKRQNGDVDPMPVQKPKIPQQLSSPGSQEQILPNMVSSSTDLHHRVADINKGDII